jgi:ABC-type multidrug transport system ATPase subunit
VVTGGAVLEARALDKRLGKRRVLAGVDLVVRRGELIGICGENGTGKSTLMRVLAGMLRPDRGSVSRSAVLGYAPQVPLLYDQLTVWEHFRYFAVARGMPERRWEASARELLERYRFTQWRAHTAAVLSGGTQQKLNLALALLADPAVLLLDEPYGGFEWETYLRFWGHARELCAAGHSLVVVSHLFYDRVILDRALVLCDGRLEEES